MKNLYLTIPQVGRVEWIGLRPARRQPLQVVTEAEISETEGLVGDRFQGKPGSKRMVTLIQSEHIDVMASILGVKTIDPGLLRRNIVVSGINLKALKSLDNTLTFRIGDAILRATGNCAPCSRMEENLGTGGYSTMRGHGGITATVVQGGRLKIGSDVQAKLPVDT